MANTTHSAILKLFHKRDKAVREKDEESFLSTQREGNNLPSFESYLELNNLRTELLKVKRVNLDKYNRKACPRDNRQRYYR